ncbi:MAG TPA: hypothetical protein VFC00_21070 [Micromonosporaceae bacterium]|nr:hypothetical protein [Micromonosporaceae bacterium]
MDSSFRRRVGFPGHSGHDRLGSPEPTPRSSTRGARGHRHTGLLAAAHRLDAEISQTAREDLARWVREEYHTELGDIPLGFVARCHLGLPYVDHILDLFNTIVEHYTPAETMPDPYAKARMLVRSGAYAYIEIYGNGEIRPVLPDGTVVI